MPSFSVNTHRIDPCKNFKFRLKWEEKYVTGVSKISPLTQNRRNYISGWRGEPNVVRKLPGTTHYESITLETWCYT